MFQLYRSYSPGINDAGFIKSVKEQAWDDSGDRDSALIFGTRDGASDPAERMRITSAGNVGIGILSPARSPLHLATSGTDYCQLHMTNGTSGSTSSDGLTLFTNGTDTGLMQRENSYLLFGTNDTERMRITSAGNVGIGTSSPASELHVDSNNTDTTITIESDLDGSSNFSSGIDFLREGEAKGSRIESVRDGSAGGVGVKFLTTADNAAEVSGTLTERMRLDRSGNLMIGTTSNDSLFHIESASSTAMTIQAGTNSSASLRLKNDAVDWDVNCQTNDNFAIYSQTASAERLVINGSGNLGMGGGPDTTHRVTVAAEQSSGKRCMLIHSINSGLACVVKNTSGTGAYDPFAFLIDGGNTQVGGIASGAGGTAFNTSSDYRLKENVDYTWDATTRLKQLKPARFNWIADDTNTLVDGFLAHEVEDIVPESITGTKDATKTHTNVVREAGGFILAEGVSEDDWTAGKADAILWTEDDILPEGVSVGDVKTESTYPSDSTWVASLEKDVYQQIDQAKLVPLLVKTIQELEARITTLENA